MPHVTFHTFPVPEFSSPAFSTPCNMVPILPVSHFERPLVGASQSTHVQLYDSILTKLLLVVVWLFCDIVMLLSESKYDDAMNRRSGITVYDPPM